MSEQRSSSAVRNLRSLFENKANQDNIDSDPRGRSPSSRLSNSESNGRPLSKIRSSFIDVVHPTMSSDSPLPNHAVSSTKRTSAFEVRTESFSTNNLDKDTVSALKKEVADEQVRRQSNPDLFAAELADEGAMESTANTPAVEPREDQAMGVIDHAAAKLTAENLPTPAEEPEEEEKQTSTTSAVEKNGTDENQPPANPDKPTTGAEEEKGSMKPALPIEEDTVSGGQALPPVAEDLRSQNKAMEKTPPKSAQKTQASATPKSVADVKSTPGKRPAMSPRNSHRPDAISTGSPAKKTEGTIKSPTSERKSSTSSKSALSPTATKPGMARKTSRTSLTAPTAASSARERRESSTVKSSAPAAKRETTKPVNLPSHLTAPTAASRAKHEAEEKKPSTGRPSVTRAVPKQQISSSKPTARTSTAARPESRSSQPTAQRKSNTTAAPSESFLERMMRPTAASASKTHDKPAEPKALPQRTKSSAKSTSAPKTNGTAKPAAKAGAVSKPVHQSKPADEKPVEEKPIEEKTVEKPVEENPFEKKPAEEKAVHELPLEKPVEQPVEKIADVEPTKPVEEVPQAVPEPETKIEESAPVNGKAEETEIPDIPVPATETETETGTATPQHITKDSETAALESTPAFGEDQIR